MENYYEEILNRIRTHMAEKNYQAAMRLLEEELAVAYIPKDIEPILTKLYEECRSELRQKSSRRYEETDIESLLSGSLDEQFMAVELLKNSNLRHHLDTVEHYLNDDPNYLVRALLIDAMMEQNIAEEMHTVVDGLQITFLPCYIEPVMCSEGAVIAANALCEWFESNDPTFLKMCMESLIQECYLHLPFNIAADEGIPLALSIVYYVLHAQGKEAEFTAFLAQNQLTEANGFALLLNKHGI